MWSVSWGTEYYRLTEFPCPSCKSTVALDASTMRKKETLRSHIRRNAEDWSPYDIEYRFSCMLVCNNSRCGEVVVVSGSIESEQELVYGEIETSMEFIEFYRPRSMYPAPPVIQISPQLSSECRNDLKAAFSLLWVDVAACASRQRIMIEHLLDQLGIPRQPVGKRPNLHSRIEKLAEEHPAHAEILDALKEVGNAGSHDGSASFKDVIECFELIEHVVTALIDRPQDKKMESARRLKAKYGRKSASNPTPFPVVETQINTPEDSTPPTSGVGD